jgi:pyruvate dehydrogenase E1 component beta subunit
VPRITMREAIRQAIDEEMARDANVILIGEEVALYQGAYKVSKGLYEKYGGKRVIDTPITEEGFTGIGIGAAIAGLRPIVEFMTFNFSIQALDQIINNAAKMLYMSGGQINVPIVFRGPNGPAEYLSSQHSQALQTLFSHIPGLKVVSPATPYDAKGLLKSSIRDNNPIIFLEGELMYAWEGEVPDNEYLVDIGKADIKKEGKDVTIITYGRPLKMVDQASEILTQEGIDVEIIDIRTLKPLDEKSIYESIAKTNRCVIVDDSWPFCSIASHIGYLVSRNAFDHLDSPVEIITSEDVPMPYSHKLEIAVQPSIEKVINAVKKVLYK